MSNQRNKRLSFQNFDIILISSVLILSIIGIFFIYSSGITSQGIQVSREYIKQIIWLVSGLVIMLVLSNIDYRRIKLIAFPAYITMIILLVLTLFFGAVVNGARSWLGIGSLGIQPSEFSKLIVIIFLASYLEDNYKELENAKTLLSSILIVSIPTLFIVLQPDLGTAMVFAPIFLSMYFLAGGKLSHLGFLVLTMIITVFLTLFFAWNQYINPQSFNVGRIFIENKLITIMLVSLIPFSLLNWLGYFIFKQKGFFISSYIMTSLSASYILTLAIEKVLQGYQLMRLVVFLNPQVDPRGSGWNIIQSVTAVGSGGLMGKGYLQGTQSHYRFLPQQSTDFIFSIFAEESGFIGTLIIFLLFSLIIYRLLYIVYTSRDYFGALIAAGLAGMISFHVIENIGMAIGVMPVTGIPLTFLSYGGSSLWTIYAGIGILLSIHQRRYRN